MMTKFLSTSILPLLVVGCTEMFDSTCDEPRGLYTLSFVTLTGDCGDIPDVEQVFGYDDGYSNCRIKRANMSEDMCSGSAIGTCYYDNGEINVLMTMDVVAPNGTAMRGTYKTTAVDKHGKVLCNGTYKFNAVKTHD